ncbi:transporter [Novosphingobium sp. NDB2Meth1]|uniref:transporter n=1 Tax=Novosphingobium sp. NDB2Meth1 TaxID=1892847 RepID=UPI000931FF60|nr:transporter [Novosphingobium sp. NDB2Meth1]
MQKLINFSVLTVVLVLPLATPAEARDARNLSASGPEVSARHDSSAEVFGGVDYEQGTYGTGAKVETASAKIGVGLRRGRVRLAAAIPYIRTTAPVDVVVSQGGLFGTPLLGSSTSQTVRTRREGIGDAAIEAAYDLPAAGFIASIGAGVKLPTASRTKGLGTGKVDYAVNAQIARPLRGGITPFAAAGYTFVGKPEGFAVRNTFAASAGTRVALSSRASAVVSYSYEQSPARSLADRQSIGLGVGVGIGKKLQLGLQGDAGLSRGAPDVKLGLRLGASF